jgi:TFIIF-interacting CTD phosphatase-like protein
MYRCQQLLRHLLPATASVTVRSQSTVSRSAPRLRSLRHLLPPRAPDDRRLFVILDMDETLIHSKFIGDPTKPDSWRMFELAPPPAFSARLAATPFAPAEGIAVYCRPGLADFLAALSRGTAAGEMEVCVFTAATKGYADTVLNAIDQPRQFCPYHQLVDHQDPHRQSVLQHRLYRDSCADMLGYEYVKELSRLGRPLERTVIVDNSPLAVWSHVSNGMSVRHVVFSSSCPTLQTA